MENALLKAAYDRITGLPDDVQADAAAALDAIAAQYETGLQLSEEQIAEVKRRLADPDPKYASDTEMKAFFDRIANEG